eukprot:90074-Rhodomonas_salina.4
MALRRPWSTAPYSSARTAYNDPRPLKRARPLAVQVVSEVSAVTAGDSCNGSPKLRAFARRAQLRVDSAIGRNASRSRTRTLNPSPSSPQALKLSFRTK